MDVIRSTLMRGPRRFMRNLLTKVPKSAQPVVAALVRSIFAQPTRSGTSTSVSSSSSSRSGDAAFTNNFPKERWREIWSNNPQERLNRELRRRTDVVGIFPNRDAIIRLVAAVPPRPSKYPP